MTTMATTAISCIYSVQLPRYSLLPLSSKRNSSTSHSIGSSTITAGMNGKMRVRDISVCSMRDDRVELDDNPEGIISGEWPENFSLLCYEDLRLYLEPQIRKDKMSPSSLLRDVMSTQIRAVTVDQTVGEIDHHFEFVSGLPVIDNVGKCIGIVSKTDKQRALHGSETKVGEIMSSPPITLPPSKTVMDAAALMLQNKIHRIPILNEESKVIGMVTRTDIFKALQPATC